MLHPFQKIKIIEFYMKTDPPMWIAANSECMKVLISYANDKQSLSTQTVQYRNEKLLKNKPFATGCKVFKNPEYDDLNLEKARHNKFSVKIQMNGL